jgi:hypothetical protein
MALIVTIPREIFFGFCAMVLLAVSYTSAHN